MRVWSESDIPDIATLREARALVAHELNSCNHNEKRDRHEAWKSRFSDDWKDKRKFAHSFCRGDEPPQPPLMKKRDGSLTGIFAEMEELVSDAWHPVFRMYAHSDAPDFAAFANRYRQHFPRHSPLGGRRYVY